MLITAVDNNKILQREDRFDSISKNLKDFLLQNPHEIGYIYLVVNNSAYDCFRDHLYQSMFYRNQLGIKTNWYNMSDPLDVYKYLHELSLELKVLSAFKKDSLELYKKHVSTRYNVSLGFTVNYQLINPVLHYNVFISKNMHMGKLHIIIPINLEMQQYLNK